MINVKITYYDLLLIFFSPRIVITGFKQWHFLCIQWNGIAGTVTYFYDGYAADSKIQNETLETQLPPGKNFSIGLGDGTGKLTQLNIWDYEIATGSVVAICHLEDSMYMEVCCLGAAWRSMSPVKASNGIVRSICQVRGS